MSKAIANMVLLIVVFLILVSALFAGTSAVAPINELHQMHQRGESGWETR